MQRRIHRLSQLLDQSFVGWPLARVVDASVQVQPLALGVEVGKFLAARHVVGSHDFGNAAFAVAGDVAGRQVQEPGVIAAAQEVEDVDRGVDVRRQGAA